MSALLRRAWARGAVVSSAILQVIALAVAGTDGAFCLAGYDAPPIGIAHVGATRIPGMGLDPLGAVVAFALALIGIPIAIYTPAYLAGRHGGLSGPVQQALLPLLLGTILAVVTAQNALVLLVGWELMTAFATFLVLADGHQDEVRRAAILYVVMSHVGTLLGMVAVLIIASGSPVLSFDSLDFESLRILGRDMGAGTRAAVLVLALVGFGTKAGIVPLHVWLPEAHPAAPSHISALLSGVIVKCGIYVVARVALDLARPVPFWFGIVLLGVGLSSALLGVLYALMEHDLKRLLAFHTVENVGIIFMGIGLGVALSQTRGLESVASLALAAGLFHIINHAVFKALLFLCAGSVHATIHDRNLEEMGGLLRKMPWTGTCFLVGALAISGMPPLNGFASEWSLLQALIASAQSSEGWIRRLAPLLVAGLALTGALAAACFVKAFGIPFLGLPRSEHARHAREVSLGPRAAQALLALACFVLGVLSPLALMLCARGGEPLGILPYLTFDSPFIISGSKIATTSPFVLAAAVTAISLAVAIATRGSRARARVAEPWVCGLERVQPRMQYTASAFTKAIRLVFRNLFRPSREVEPAEGTPPYYVRRWRTQGMILPVFERYLYDPLVSAVRRIAALMDGWASPSTEVGLFLTLVAFCVALWWAL
ncbi:hydrogenase 4 subunit B [bacterium]|nr:hydrogenase 4 subunit B [bacterium]